MAAPETLSLNTPDGVRPMLVVRPPAALPGSRRPLVILLHGRGSSAGAVLGESRILRSPLAAWVPIAMRENVIVVALQGMRGENGAPAGWNDCRQGDTFKPHADDVAYVRAAITRLEADDSVDPARIYVMGMSNGAIMAFRLAQELGQPLAGLVAVSGPLAAGDGCAPLRTPLSVMLVHGTADPIVPFAGGEVRVRDAERGQVLSVEDTLERLLELDHLSGAGVVVPVPHRGTLDDATRVDEHLWGGDAHGLQVALVRIEGGGHAEPTLEYPYGPIYVGLAGPQNHDVESAELAWQFFKDKRAQATP